MADQLEARIRELNDERGRLRDVTVRFGEALAATHDIGELLRVVVETAMEATGASRLQVILFAILPQALPQFVTYNLYWFEVGVRSATVLGMVGAGGIGFELITSIRLFEWREVGIILLFILGPWLPSNIFI